MARSNSPRPNPKLSLGAWFFAAAAVADAALTLHGTGGDSSLEGNPWLRAAMLRCGSGLGLLAPKVAVGILCFLIARYGEGEIKRRAPWIEMVPSTPWARAWMKSGDRSWIAYLPLYGIGLCQLIGALSWLTIGLAK